MARSTGGESVDNYVFGFVMGLLFGIFAAGLCSMARSDGEA